MQPALDPHLPWRTKDELEDDGEPCGILAIVDARGETVGHLYVPRQAARLTAAVNYLDPLVASLAAVINGTPGARTTATELLATVRAARRDRLQT